MDKTSRATVFDYAAWTLAVLGVIFVLKFHLLPALIAGLLVCELVLSIYPLFVSYLPTHRAKAIAVGLVALIVIAIVTAATLALVAFVKSEGGSLPALLDKMAEIIANSRDQMPPWIAAYLPADSQAISDNLSGWLRAHASQLPQLGRRTGHTLAHVLVAMVIGAMISLREALGADAAGPFARSLAERMSRLGEAFRRIVFAQVRISALNTALTAIYLVLILPAFGVHLPLTKTMIVVTFLAGLLPVIGNLISNTVVVVVSFAHSPVVALSSLIFLVVIHKLEYFLNARIVGAMIRAKAWELLAAMLVMESAFGLAGLVIAPICYAWLKDELKQQGLI